MSGRQAGKPDQAPIAPRPGCPAWCFDAERHTAADIGCGISGDLAGRLLRPHTGPRFGPFSVGGDSDALTGQMFVGAWVDVVVLERLDLDDPASLRQIAADASAAAEWLAAQA